jgi:NADH dehydrogenase [ubiquinone] 1 alpha subcomplex assembly factor 5
MTLFDPKAYALHQKRAQKEFHKHAFLFDHVGNELISRLEDLKKTFKNPLHLAPNPLPHPRSAVSENPEIHKKAGLLTLEQPLPFEAGSFDLIVSCLQAHWVNDLPTYLKNIYACLQNEGLFLGALWGGRTLFELRESLMHAELALTGGASPRIAPMLHPADAPTLLGRAGFFMPVVDADTITVTYPSLMNLMKDLRGMGETNKLFDRPKAFTAKALFEKTEEVYLQRFPQPNPTFSATFEVIFLTGWKYQRD